MLFCWQLFVMNQLEKEASLKAMEEERIKQQEKTTADLRKNDLRIVRDKFKSSLLNQWFVETIYKVLYEVEDFVAQFNFLTLDVLNCKGSLEESLSVEVKGNKDKLQFALCKSFFHVGNIATILTKQRTLLEAANESPYGWSAAKYM